MGRLSAACCVAPSRSRQITAQRDDPREKIVVPEAATERAKAKTEQTLHICA